MMSNRLPTTFPNGKQLYFTVDTAGRFNRLIAATRNPSTSWEAIVTLFQNAIQNSRHISWHSCSLCISRSNTCSLYVYESVLLNTNPAIHSCFIGEACNIPCHISTLCSHARINHLSSRVSASQPARTEVDHRGYRSRPSIMSTPEANQSHLCQR